MKIEVWSDVVCPWCYVGKRNLEAALAQFGQADQVEVVWRSFELDPAAPREREGDYATRLSTKYGVSQGDARAMIARIVDAGAKAGVDFRFDHARPGNTFDAHRLLHLAAAGGSDVQGKAKERLLEATFTEGRPIGDRDTLVELGVEIGLDEDAVRAVLDSDQFAADVRRDEAEAAELGARGVPFFVFDRRYGVSGAQPPEVFVDVLRRTWREAHPIEVIDGGDLCADGSCDL